MQTKPTAKGMVANPDAVPTKFTIFGGSGFIGAHLIRYLQANSVPCWSPKRGEDILGRPLGHVIYCIGLTADFRYRPFETVDAHVCRPWHILRNADLESFLYLSSTRIYAGAASTHEEATLQVNPLQPDELYNLSKMMGESLCLSAQRPNVRIARLSNVYGTGSSTENFLASIIRDAVIDGKVLLRSTLASQKDYIGIDDVVRVLPDIARSGRHKVYNVASGVNISNEALIRELQRETECSAEVADDAATLVFPSIDIGRIQREYRFVPSSLLDSLGGLVSEYRQRRAGQNGG